MQLDRVRIVRAALEVLNESGLDKLTVRRVADRLGVKNPALYWHFENKQDLLNSMAQSMLNEALAHLHPGPPDDAIAPSADRTASSSGEDSWKSYLRQFAICFYEAAVSRRDGARVIAGADLSVGILQEKIAVAQHVLGEAGFDPETSLLHTVTLLDFSLGAAFESQADPGADLGADIRRTGFHHGVGLILSGIAAQRDGAEQPDGRSSSAGQQCGESQGFHPQRT